MNIYRAPLRPVRYSRNRRLVLAALLVVAGAALELPAQQVAQAGPYATRAQLESLATVSARVAADTKADPTTRDASARAANMYRERLQGGDFRAGDRLALQLGATAAPAETLTVAAGRHVRLPEVGDVSLDGVLRSELQSYLTTQLARALRSPELHVEPLTRVGVLGEARLPGFVYVAGHSPLSDVIMTAGGPTANSDLSHVILRRDGKTLMTREAFARALAAGTTLDDLDVRAGDEIFIERVATHNWTQMIQTVVVVFGAAMTFVAIRASH